ncbi:hypothetical protein B9Z65_3341 [Elsinoe australis]|uniref:Rhodopsin domain-containing protein n=1 Tax=Elsinoe australis TaxID=40998 RepID=A0A2P7ZY37_9PEZI|nr:hypothetical protein B9Z65_3341 [Elsinoe australis]
MPTTVVSTAIAPDKLADYQEPPSLLRSELSGLVAVSFIFLLTTWTTVGLRMYVRTCLVKAVGADDWFMVVTLLFFSAYSIACCILSFDILASVTEYAAGQIPTTNTLPNAIVTVYTLYCATMVAFKFSLGFFFLKIFANSRPTRILLYASVIVPTLVGILNVAWTAAFPCQVKTLFFAGLPACIDSTPRADWLIIGGVWSAFTAITDLLYGVLSFLAIRKLQMSRRDKLSAAGLCALGTIGGVASVIRLCVLVIPFPTVSVLGEGIHTSIWSLIEPGVGITAAAMASLRPLVKKVRNATDRTSNKTHSDYRQNGGTVITAQPTQVGLATAKSVKGGIMVEVELDQTGGKLEMDIDKV